MSNIPKNIKKEHIISAIQEIDNSGISNSRRNATEYALFYNDKEYPPKYIISLANKYANNEELSSNDFNSIQSRTFLTNLGFECIKKSDSLKNDFAKWLLKNGATSYRDYYGNTIEEIEVKLDEINAFFKSRDVFQLENGNIEELKSFLTNNIYGVNRENNKAFFEYDKIKGNGRPKAILGKSNYFVFLDEMNMNNNKSEKHNLKTEFLNIWPEERVKKMTLEEYTNLNRDDSFCYWLESSTTSLGSIWGGSAYKFGVFKKSEKSEISKNRGRQTDGVYGWYSKYGENKEEAFLNIKKNILNIIDNVKNDNLEAIDNIDLGFSYKWKIAFLYGNYNLINIFKYDALKFLSIANSIEDTRNKSASIYNRFLLNLKRNNEDYFEFTQKLWNHYEISERVDSNEVAKQKKLFIQYLIAKNLDIEIAEELEDLSSEVVSKGYSRFSIFECITLQDTFNFSFESPISENWDNLFEHYYHFVIEQIKLKTGIDLSISYGLVTANDEDEYNDFIKESYWSTNNKNVYSQYLNGFSKGSKIALYSYEKRKERTIYAIGTLTDEITDEKRIPVKWNTNFGSFDTPSISETGSLDFYEIEAHRNQNKIDEIKNIFYNPATMKEEYTPLNQILYGPPGTGKTYTIINDYINVQKPKIEQVDDSKVYVDEKRNFWHLAPGESGYLWNELKNQNYLGYEWCSISLGDLSKLEKKNTENFDIKLRFSKVKKGDYFCIISGKKFYSIAKALHDYDYGKSKNSNFDFQTIEVEWLKHFSKPELLNTYSTQSFSGTKWGKRWNSIIEALENQDIFFLSQKGKSIEKNVANFSLISFHQSFSYEDFIEGIKPDLENNNEEEKNSEISYSIQDGVFKIACDKAANIAGYEDLLDCINDTKENRQQTFKNAKPFYLLIDEINRGNVSSIFGELITLIENDKRLGGANELILDLPYSKKSFSVPANLHIIGTMNTADRSVEALDTALRRRFSFTEVAPNSELLKGKKVEEVELKKLLETINDRIELLIDKDHKIGHSYFLNIETLEDLKQTFKNKVIPLLEEYFFGDYGKIGLVLGSAFIELKEDKAKVAFAKNFIKVYEEAESLREKAVYTFIDENNWEASSFISIYEQ
jgi:5-methylcytosine-specific restriction endonuclease McrBC GTP-binding regulatory subunit McrB